MDTTIKKTIDFVSLVNKSTREYLNTLIDNQTTKPKVLTKIEIDKAFDDMNIQTKAYDLILDQKNFILQVNYFIRYAILRWLQVKNSSDMGDILDRKDINFVFDQVDKSILKTTKK